MFITRTGFGFPLLSFLKFHPGEGVGFATKQMGGTSLTRPPSDVGNLKYKEVRVYREENDNK